MKTILLLSFLVSAVTVGVPAHAQTYQWKDSSGRTVISDTPPPGSTKVAQTIDSKPKSKTETPVENTEKTPKTMAEKDMAFKKRQLEAKEKKAKEAKEQATAAEKQENCQRARNNLATLESNQQVQTIDENGQRITMDNAARQQEMERARKVMADSCK